MWSPAPMPAPVRTSASRLARSSSCANVSRRAGDTITPRSGTASATRSNRSARLKPLTGRIYDAPSDLGAALDRAAAVAEDDQRAEGHVADLPDPVLEHGGAAGVEHLAGRMKLVVDVRLVWAGELDRHDLGTPLAPRRLVFRGRLLQCRAEGVALLEQADRGCLRGAAVQEQLPVLRDLGLRRGLVRRRGRRRRGGWRARRRRVVVGRCGVAAVAAAGGGKDGSGKGGHDEAKTDHGRTLARRGRPGGRFPKTRSGPPTTNLTGRHIMRGNPGRKD